MNKPIGQALQRTGKQFANKRDELKVFGKNVSHYLGRATQGIQANHLESICFGKPPQGMHGKPIIVVRLFMQAVQEGRIHQQFSARRQESCHFEPEEIRIGNKLEYVGKNDGLKLSSLKGQGIAKVAGVVKMGLAV